MTLEEAIQQLETDINSELDHTQVLEWLQQLKRAKEHLKDELERKKKELEAAQRSIELDLALRKIPSLIQECHFD